jgi:hypothetical protein
MVLLLRLCRSCLNRQKPEVALVLSRPKEFVDPVRRHARLCATSEFRQIRPQNKSVFNRQGRPKSYLFPISQVLHTSKTGTCLRRSGVYQLRYRHRTFMTFFHQFSALAASRNEGLHPKLQTLLERAAAAPFSEVSMRPDGLIQAGPSPDSEVVSSRDNVTPFSREPARAVGNRPRFANR